MYKNYFDLEYSEFWKKQSKVYGMEDGLDEILDILKRSNPKKVFEIGIGTGWPLAEGLENNGAEVSGCDISSNSIAFAQKKYPNMKLEVGTIWDIEVGHAMYDLVYCIRSSWYMEDFLDVIDKMIDMTKRGGVVVFNIINEKNRNNRYALVKGPFYRAVNRCVGALKVLLLNRDYIAPCPSNYFHSQDEIETILRKHSNIQYTIYSTNQLMGDAQFDPKGQKLCFVIHV